MSEESLFENLSRNFIHAQQNKFLISLLKQSFEALDGIRLTNGAIFVIGQQLRVRATRYSSHKFSFKQEDYNLSQS